MLEKLFLAILVTFSLYLSVDFNKFYPSSISSVKQLPKVTNQTVSHLPINSTND
ncbi:MAG: hypothetical protein F6K14_06425 [Symploca sp. SIO2C1]|nr:hypothetical protein [Symploca sp. SIO2C1]